MFMQEKETGTLVKVMEVDELIDPLQTSIKARKQAGEEEQSLAPYEKSNLTFPSGEALPRCWVDPNYQMK